MAQIDELELMVRGMTCDSCALHVERALKKVLGVRKVEVPGWQSGRARVFIEPDVDTQALIEAVRLAGYTAAVETQQPLGEHAVTQVRASKSRADDHFDLMIIGGGSAGFAAAIKAAELGARTALVEASTIGGTCVNVGCVPSKTLIRAMEQYYLAGQSRFRGVHTLPGMLNWAQVIADKDRLVEEMRQSKYVDVLAAYPEISYIKGRAHLTGENRVEVDGKSFRPGKIIIATGAQPWAPSIPGLTGGASYDATLPYLTSTTAMELKELPRSLIVLGANAVGLELAQTFARAGVHVTLLELLPRIAPFEEEEISAALHRCLEDEGIQVVTGFKTTRVSKQDGRYIVVGVETPWQDVSMTTLSPTMPPRELTFAAEQLLVATGRRPNTNGLGLERGGVKIGSRGEVLVDKTLRTDNPNIYAAGDVTGRDMFVYVAAYSGGLAAENALTGAGRVYDASYIPRVTFTDPQIASAGLTEDQARQQGYPVRTSTLPMSRVPRALAARDTRGLIKLVADSGSDRLIGAHILAAEAGEMIQIAVLTIRFGITLTQLRETIFPYLTNTEGLKLAALAFEKDVALLSCCAG